MYLALLLCAVQNSADGPGGITLRHLLRAAARKKIALRVMEGLAAKFAARKRVPLQDEPIMAALLSLDQTLELTSRLALNDNEGYR